MDPELFRHVRKELTAPSSGKEKGERRELEPLPTRLDVARLTGHSAPFFPQ
jgi:hypothetical protein